MDSFGASNTTKAGQNNLGGTSDLALNTQFPQVSMAGKNLLNMGAPNVQAGTNFFSSVLNGNQANTGAALQPGIDQIRRNVQNSLSSINTLTPRSGGRFSSLFDLSFLPQQQMQNLFNTARTDAATTLPQIGLQQQGLGTNLFSIGNQALNAATGANAPLVQSGQNQQKITSDLWGQLGRGLFGLATTPFGGGTASNGLLGLL